jgi:hypothetical protein
MFVVATGASISGTPQHRVQAKSKGNDDSFVELRMLLGPQNFGLAGTLRFTVELYALDLCVSLVSVDDAAF